MGANVSAKHEELRRQESKTEAELSDIPARVDKVNVTGLKRTKKDYVHRVSDHLFKVNNFHDVLVECNNAKNYLNKLGIFKDVVVHIDVSKGKNKTPNGYEVTFDGTELSPMTGQVGTEFGSNDGGLKISLEAPNFAGRGERASVRAIRTTTSASDVALTLLKPLHHTNFREYHPEISLSLFRNHLAFPYMACRTSNFGVLGEFNFSTPALRLSHSLQYEASFRELFPMKGNVPFSVRESSGPRMMSACRLSTIYDIRDDSIFPTQGVYVKTTNELSGFGGDVSYISNTTHGELNIPLPFDWVAQIVSKIGIIQGIRSPQILPISSLFSLGGPLNLRGFELAGAGPHDQEYANGVTSFWAIGLHLWMPMPYHRQCPNLITNWRTHLFCNFGNCDSLNINNMRIAIGAGLAIPIFQRARIEINWCIPINSLQNDRINPGIQFGIGTDFL